MLLAEGRGERSNEYIFEPGSFAPLCRFGEEGFETYHNDHLGTPRELTDERGQVVWSATYDVYGRVSQAHTEKAANRIRFQGQYEDVETGLFYNFHRYYDPDAGRYINKDPIGLIGGLNHYVYEKNPINWVDPLGLSAWNEFQQALSQAGVKVSRPEAARLYSHLNAGTGRMSRPSVTDPRLQNIVNDLYKGDRMPHVIGTGSTADAARIEYASGQRIHGRDHIGKSQQYMNAVDNWLRRNPMASGADINTAKALRNDMDNAIKGC